MRNELGIRYLHQHDRELICASRKSRSQSHLVTLQKSIEEQARIRQHVSRKGMQLLYAASIWRERFAHIRDRDVIVGTISRTPRILIADIGCRRMSKIVVH